MVLSSFADCIEEAHNPPAKHPVRYGAALILAFHWRHMQATPGWSRPSKHQTDRRTHRVASFAKAFSVASC